MKKLIVGLMSVMGLSNIAAASVIDKFRCATDFVDKRGRVGIHVENDVNVDRIPIAQDPHWVAGVTATAGRARFKVGNADDAAISVALEYTTYLYDDPATAEKSAAQWHCNGIRGVQDGDTESESSCSGQLVHPPYNPVSMNPRVPIDDNGVPAFATTSIRSWREEFHRSATWRSATVNCQYLETVAHE